jgi:hypothetical protein
MRGEDRGMDAVSDRNVRVLRLRPCFGTMERKLVPFTFSTNVLNRLPRSAQSKAKTALQNIWMVETRKVG